MSSDDQRPSPEAAGGGSTERVPSICLACRGSGRVVSGLGGTEHPVTCPWCRGSAQRVPGIDAQAAPAEPAPAASAPAEPVPAESASAGSTRPAGR